MSHGNFNALIIKQNRKCDLIRCQVRSEGKGNDRPALPAWDPQPPEAIHPGAQGGGGLSEEAGAPPQ